MKNAVLLPLGLFLMALACSCYFEGWNNGITGAGNVVEEKRDLDGFTGLHITSGVDVFLSQDAEYTVRVEADENLVEMIKTEVKGELLEVGVEKPGIRRAESKKVFVSLPDLKSIRVSSAGDCTGETPFRCEELDIEVSSAGDLTMEVYARRIDLDISSSGDVKLSGEAGDFEADLSSAGDLDAFDLTAKRVDVSVSSAGNAKVFATEELRMVSSSAGYIYYRGDAKIIRSSSSSAGNIISQN